MGSPLGWGAVAGWYWQAVEPIVWWSPWSLCTVRLVHPVPHVKGTLIQQMAGGVQGMAVMLAVL